MNNKDFYKEVIYEGFFPDGKSIQPNFAVAEKAVKHYKAIFESYGDLIDVMLYYVETGSEFMNEFGGIDADVCTNLEETFEEALKCIAENNLKNEFKAYCLKIVGNASDGYGFSDSLKASFETYF